MEILIFFLYILTDAASVRVGSFAELLFHKMLGGTVGLLLDKVLLSELLHQDGKRGACARPLDVAMTWLPLKQAVEVVRIRVCVYPFPFRPFAVQYVHSLPLPRHNPFVSMSVISYGKRIFVGRDSLLPALSAFVGAAFAMAVSVPRIFLDEAVEPSVRHLQGDYSVESVAPSLRRVVRHNTCQIPRQGEIIERVAAGVDGKYGEAEDDADGFAHLILVYVSVEASVLVEFHEP